MADLNPTAVGDHTLVFLAGLHRSGTSLLFKCLREHPETTGFETTGASEDEGMLLQTVYPPAYEYGGPGVFGFSPEMHMDENHPLCTPENRVRLFKQWAPYWNLEKSLLLEKSPPNLTKTRFLQGLFPNSHFIVITRHPIAVALATRKWSKTSLADLIEHWLICHESFEAARPHLKACTLLRYEDFIQNPNQYLINLYTSLGVESQETGLIVKSTINERYFQRWKKLSSGPLTGFQIRKIQRRFEERVSRFDYSLSV